MIYLAGMIILNLPFEIGNTQYEINLITDYSCLLL